MSGDLIDRKKNLRALYGKKLNDLDFFSLIEKSSKLSAQFFRFVEQNESEFKKRFAVSFYPFETEPQINIEKEARDEPYQVAYVRIVDWKSGHMEAREARRDLPEQWEEYELKNGARIFQPKATQAECISDRVAVVLVPGLAFTKDGLRLGRGAGFYDRYLKQNSGALRVGVAFETQIAGDIPTEPWDEPLDLLLTDEGIYSTKSYGEWKINGRVLDRQRNL